MAKTKVLKHEYYTNYKLLVEFTKGNFCPYRVYSVDRKIFYGSFRKDQVHDIALRIKMAYDLGKAVGEQEGAAQVKADIKKYFGIKE